MFVMQICKEICSWQNFEQNEENAEANVLCVEAEALKLCEIISKIYSKFHIFWQMELVCFFRVCWYNLFILRDETCQCYLIYEKVNDDVATNRLEWVGDTLQR